MFIKTVFSYKNNCFCYNYKSLKVERLFWKLKNMPLIIEICYFVHLFIERKIAISILEMDIAMNWSTFSSVIVFGDEYINELEML